MHLAVISLIAAFRLGDNPRRTGHRLHSAGDAQVCISDRNFATCRHDRLETGTAQPVLGGPWNRSRDARQQARHASDISVLLACAVPVAKVHIVESRWVEGRRSLQQRFDNACRKVVWAHTRQSAPDATDRGTHSVDDEGVNHCCRRDHRRAPRGVGEPGRTAMAAIAEAARRCRAALPTPSRLRWHQG